MTKTHPSSRVVRIGGASGFWGDSMVGAPQLAKCGLIDYLVFDYLAETTMAILAAARAKKPEFGYATDFVDSAMKQVLPEVMKRGIKVIGATIMPYGGSAYYHPAPPSEADRQAIDRWIRAPGDVERSAAL